MPSRETVRLSLACDNLCVFCGQDGVTSRASAVSEQLTDARARSNELTFVGGEPLLDAELEDHVAEARRHGFRRIGLQTNGRTLGDGDRAARLARAGLTDIHLSIHGADAAVHDYHTGRPGSLEAALRGLAAAKAEGLEIVVTTLVTRSSFRTLAAVPRLLSSRGVSAWALSIPRVAGRSHVSFDRVVPRLALAMPFALHAMTLAGSLGLPAFIHGAPVCLLGPFADRVLVDAPRAFGAPCETCSAAPVCPGVDATYLARFGGDELTACARTDPRETHPELRAMFVGPGELAAAPAPPPAARAKVALPMAGKVRPATSEVAPSSPKRSGEALREILPALFEGPPREDQDA